jgi:hypothetical protein
MLSLNTQQRSLNPSAARNKVARRRPRPLALEALEDRTVLSVSLEASGTLTHLVGDPVTWTATSSDLGNTPVYQFSVGPASGPSHVVRDFSPNNSFTWDPLQEGSYDVRVIVKAAYQSLGSEDAVASYAVISRATGPGAVITPTSNPLVALYSAPPSPSATLFVEFRKAGGDPSWQRTNTQAVVPGESTNFLVAGMLPDTTYQMRHVLSDGTASPPLLFTTGSLPTDLGFPAYTVTQPPGPGSDVSQGMIFHASAVATDLDGHVNWYYDSAGAGLQSVLAPSLVPGGTGLVLGSLSGTADGGLNNVVREIDLAGNTLRETNLDAVNAQLAARGQRAVTGFHHEAQRLPNGDTAVLAYTEQTVNVNGTPTVYTGDMIIVLDQDFQVVWTWDAFNYLDTNRGPTLGEQADGVVDWLHSNAIAWSPEDGDLLLSMRHQDWVIKIDYRNGSGDGHVVWRLGADGDFTVNSTAPSPWFSHQHGVRFIDDTTLVLFDNGNVRRASDPNADSRGQVWRLNEQTMTATLVLNADLGNYSFAVGSAQELPNGNFVFTSGLQAGPVGFFGQSIEVLPDGTPVYSLETPGGEYRTYRMSGLYGYDTTTLLSTSGGASVFGQAVTFTAAVSAAAVVPGSGTPGGVVTFLDGGTVLATVPLDAGGRAAFSTAALAAGGHTVTAIYSGDGRFFNSTSAAVPQAVSQDGTVLALAASPSLSVFGQAVTFTAAVSAAAPGSGTPTGVVTYMDGGTVLARVPLDAGGRAAFSTAALAAGGHIVTALYSGDGNFLGTSAGVAQAVGKDGTVLALASSPNSSVYGQAVTFTASVSAVSPGSGTPTGVVTFLDGGTVLATVPLDAGGRAAFTTAALPAGGHAVTATYSGDGNFAAGGSAVVNQVVSQGVGGGGQSRPEYIGMFDPNTGTWYLRGSNSAGPPAAGQFRFGTASSVPVSGDWTGTSADTIGVFDQNTFTWYLRSANSAGPPDAGQFQYGASGWLPVTGDWHNSGHTGVGVFDPATATWYLRNEASAGAPDAGVFRYGVAGGIAVVGDWTGTGHLGIGDFDPATATWFLRSSVSPGAPDVGVFQYGGVGFKAVAGDWAGSGHAGIGVFDPATATWYLRAEPTAGAPDGGAFAFGGTNFLPAVGTFPPLAQHLLAAGGEGPGGVAPLGADELQSAVAGALAQVGAAGAGPGLLARLASAEYDVGALPPGVLGLAEVGAGRVTISADAAGYGWSVDGGSMDLSTALLHEMGHLAGLPDEGAASRPGDLMADALAPGTRSTQALDQVFAQAAVLP